MPIALLAALLAAAPDTVVLADGTVLRGTIISCDGPKLVIDDGGARSVPAGEVRSVSRGGCRLEKAAEPEVPTRWYGWQTLLTDAGAIGFVALTAKHGNADTTSTALGITAAAIYVAGGPAVHFAHGRAKTALGSLALRVGLPVGAGVVGGLIGAASDSSKCTSDDCGLGGLIGAFFGAVIGGAAAVAIDSAVLAREPVAPAVALAPSLQLKNGRTSIGLAARF